MAKAPAKFTVETFGAGDGEVAVEVVGPGQVSVLENIFFSSSLTKRPNKLARLSLKKGISSLV